MPAKKVVVFFNKPPIGSLHYAEGFRASVGLGAGIDEHEIIVVCLGEGVYNVLKNVERKEVFRYIDTFLNRLEVPGKLLVEEEALKERKIEADEVGDEWMIISREEIARIVSEADVTVGAF